MFKKLLIASVILITTSSLTLANPSSPYLGASTGVNIFSTSNGGVFRGMPLTVFGGYGATIGQDIYLAGELFATLATLALDNSPTTQASLRSTGNYGASVIPGLLLTDHTLAFVRAGLIRNYFSTIRSSSTGGQLGFGMQTGLTQNWDLRGEYDYTSFRQVGGISPRSDLFSVGLVYRIN